MAAFGNDYIEMETKVIIRAAENSLTAFQPEFTHGSTVSYNVEQLGVAMTSSKRVLDAYNEAIRSATGICRSDVVGVRGTQEGDSDSD